jgi:hypothetical protein
MNTTLATPDPSNRRSIHQIYLAKAVDIADLTLSLYTGHDEYERRKVAIYAMATCFVRQFDPFPGLALYGPPGTGKSNTENVLKNLCWKVVPVTAETVTEAALKQCMADANEGTLVIEEADKLSASELEGIIITRYSRSSAVWKKMLSDGKDWSLGDFRTFGATVVHRRNLFRDPALLRRVITVRTVRRQGEYLPFNEKHPLFRLYWNYLKVLPKLPEVTSPLGVEPSIFECYRPLVAVATYIGDEGFLSSLKGEMQTASARLKKEETYLEAPTLLKVIIGLVHEVTRGKFTLDRVNIETRNLRPALSEEFGSSSSVLMLSANQRNRIIEEDLGFKTGSSHGRSRIYLTIPLLIEKCDEFGVKDDLIEEWRGQMKGAE